MTILLGFCGLTLVVGLIGLAIYKKDYVRASFSIRSAGFFLEARNNDAPTRQSETITEKT